LTEEERERRIADAKLNGLDEKVRRKKRTRDVTPIEELASEEHKRLRTSPQRYQEESFDGPFRKPRRSAAQKSVEKLREVYGDVDSDDDYSEEYDDQDEDEVEESESDEDEIESRPMSQFSPENYEPIISSMQVEVNGDRRSPSQRIPLSSTPVSEQGNFN
jgi:hypothetical protein